MPSNSSLKKEVKTLQDARGKDLLMLSRFSDRIAELEARLKEKEDYISQHRAIAMVKAGYESSGGKCFLTEISKTVKDKKKEKEKKNKFVNGLTRTRRRCWKDITYADSPIEVENSAKPSVLKKNKIKIKRKNNSLLKYVVKEVNLLEDMAKKLKPPKKTYSNDVIFIERNQYHMDKIKEKDNLIEEKNKEIATLNKRIAQKNELLKDIEWRVRCSIGNTYQAKLQSGQFVESFHNLIKTLDSYAATSNYNTPYELKNVMNKWGRYSKWG